ncbi:thioredoxin domain-containing protein [Candidatus Micrarchaeota archaeon]|nr:thioredoxin domain-containing protein [Candidatus Micrarchaeota archaeon]
MRFFMLASLVLAVLLLGCIESGRPDPLDVARTDFVLPQGTSTPSAATQTPVPITEETPSAAGSPSTTSTPRPVLSESDWVEPELGSDQAPVVIVAYEDLQDRFTKQFYDASFYSVVGTYIQSGQVRFQYRPFPLSFHERAREAAEAAYCAHEQTRFWDYHDKVLRDQSRLNARTVFKDFASELGLNRELFDSCFDSGKYAGRVEQQVEEAVDLGISGTPTFYINAKALVGAQPSEAFDAAIRRELGLPVSPTPTPSPTLRPSVHARDLISTYAGMRGRADAPVIVVEFSDYQCPFCRRFYAETLPLIQGDYIDSGKVRFYFKDFPLSFHPMAHVSSEAARCAGDQGKYWQMHDKMFGEQNADSSGTTTVNYSVDDLKAWAREIGLDGTAFDACLDSGKYKDSVAADYREGVSAGISGTPSFVINGQTLVGAQPYSAFKSVIDAELGN